MRASYEFLSDGWGVIKKGTVNFSAQLMSIDYKEFRDLRGSEPVGQEPLYSLKANIYQVFFSFWY